MESPINKKVRLRNRFKKTYLVASDDGTVTHVCLGNNTSKPENLVWLIKSKNPDKKKSVCLESIYGKMLAWSSLNSVFQMDRRPRSSKNDESTGIKADVHNWWTLEEVDNGFTSVKIRVRGKHAIYLYPDTESSQVKLRKGEFSWLGSSSCFVQELFYWDVEIVDTSTTIDDNTNTSTNNTNNRMVMIDKPSNDRAIIIPENNYNRVQSGCERNSTSYIYQVRQMHVHNVYNNKPDGMAATGYPFANYANTGANKNVSGTQIIGSVNVQTKIDHMVNTKIVKRDG